MNNIYDCVASFQALLDTEYHLVLGRKGVAVTLRIRFDKKDCYHLMGLQYLTDRVELRRDRSVVFDEIRDGIITVAQIEASDFYKNIAERVDMLPLLENMFDRNDTIFKYNRRNNMYSMIEADYLMKNRAGSRNVFVFLSRKTGDQYYCRSFFPQSKRDYTENQASWTLLYKEKIKLSTAESLLLYDRLKK